MEPRRVGRGELGGLLGHPRGSLAAMEPWRDGRGEVNKGLPRVGTGAQPQWSRGVRLR
jgi:hypothetical protein